VRSNVLKRKLDQYILQVCTALIRKGAINADSRIEASNRDTKSSGRS
jgi:hypothetical protein